MTKIQRVEQLTAECEKEIGSMAGTPMVELIACYHALKVAHGLVVRHHEISLWRERGFGFCPVCHRKDGTEPEMDQIQAALAAMEVKVE